LLEALDTTNQWLTNSALGLSFFFEALPRGILE
jgi:hypothetical protein